MTSGGELYGGVATEAGFCGVSPTTADRSEALLASVHVCLTPAALAVRSGDRTARVCGENGAQRRDLVLEVRDCALQRLVVASENFDLGLEVREPRLFCAADT